MESEVCTHKYLEELEIGLCCMSCGALRNFISETSDTPPTSKDPSDKAYQYVPLLAGEIRLIVLLPGVQGEPFSCDIIKVQLQTESLVRYEAVSYTWATEDGDASRSKSIRVYSEGGSEQKYIKVTKNCFRALRQLWRNRSESEVLGVDMLWVDSICINQNSIRERNQQVSMMDQIYKNAAQVDICIPMRMTVRDHDYRGAMELLDPQNHVVDMQTDRFRPEKYRFCHVVHHHVVQLARLFDLRYFSRVWVVQEVTLAQKVLMYIDDKAVPIRSDLLRHICDTYISQTISIPRLSRWVSVWNKAPGIVSCLNMSLNCSASDTRDKVFAITGLLNPCTRAIIPIDYISSVDEVLQTAVTACIAERGNLDILRYAVLAKNTDIHTAPSFNIVQFKDYLAHQANLDLSDPSQAQSQDNHARFLMTPKGGCKRCGPPTQHSTIWNRTCAFRYNASSHIRTFEALNDAIPPTQILPRLRVHAYPIDKCTHATSQTLPALLDELRTRRTAHTPTRILAGDFRKHVADLWSARCGKMQAQVDYTVFRTWHSVGFTLGHCLPGDIVTTMDDYAHIFLLRGVGYRRFRIVGECYLWDYREVAGMNNGSLGRGTWGDHFGGREQCVEIF